MAFSVAVAIVVSCLALCIEAGQQNREKESWPTFCHDFARTCHTNEVVEPPLNLLWNFDPELQTRSFRKISSPVVANDAVYFGTKDTLSYNSYIYALNITFRYSLTFLSILQVLSF